MLKSTLQQTDPEIYNIIQKEAERQEYGIELIASENYTSKAVMEAMKEQKTHFQDLRKLSPEAGVEQLTRMTDTLLRIVFLRLYGRGI